MAKTFRYVLGPLFLMTACPLLMILIWYTNVSLGGSLSRLLEMILAQGFFYTLYQIWSPIFFGTREAWLVLAIFAATQLLFMKVLPGKTFHGPETPKGNVPVYKANGVPAFFLTVGLFCVGSFSLGLFSPTIIYDNFGALLSALNVFSLLFCLFLYFKGRYFPSSSDQGISGNPLFDYYWGTELYPRVLGWDIKMFTNCRIGMMGWALIILSFAAKQKQLFGVVSDAMLVGVALQLIYIAKFFFWETGYLRSLDIMHDRAGFYICWGCLVWVPCVYTSPILYLVNHPNTLGTFLTLALFSVGAGAILVNYLADRQRQRFRAAYGQCMVWKKKPVITMASYTTERGEQKSSLLLASGWWGIARHFHYLPEILGALCWSLPALFDNFLPYFYVVFLTILLVDRAVRDEKRCAKKYGPDWDKYCQHVPYRMIPYIF